MGSWIKEKLLGGSDETTWDVFLAWRCGCKFSHRVVYRTISDVPSTAGYHDACPHCYYAPLEVTRG